MAYNMKRGAAPKFKELGSSPAKQVEGNFNRTGSGASTTPGYSTTKAAKVAKEAKSYTNPSQGVKKAMGKVKEITRKITKPSHGDSYAKQLTGQYGKRPVAARKLVKKSLGKIAKKVGSKFLGPVGAALTAYDVIKTAPKVAKATVKGLKERAKSGNVNIGRKL